MRAAEVARGAAGPSVSSAGAFAGEALGDRGHVDAAPDLSLRRKARTDQPAHEDLSGPSLKRQSADRLDGTRRLADQHDAVVGVPAQDRGGMGQVTCLHASCASEDLPGKPAQPDWSTTDTV